MFSIELSTLTDSPAWLWQAVDLEGRLAVGIGSRRQRSLVRERDFYTLVDFTLLCDAQDEVLYPPFAWNEWNGTPVRYSQKESTAGSSTI